MSNAKQIRLYPLHIHQDAPVVTDVKASIEAALNEVMKSKQFQSLKPGASIAVTAGSRGIANYVLILQTVIQLLKDRGFSPFLFSAMGSHGRGEAAGQREVLDSLNITEQLMGCPVSCSSEVEQIDHIEFDGKQLPLFCAKEAWEADGILVINRIKPHTSFRGPYESGLNKMMAVGMGRAKGATIFHSQGASGLATILPKLGERMLALAPIIGGIGIVENSQEQTAIVEGIPAESIMEREVVLLEKAKAFMPKLPVEQADLCIIGEMGKNFSGTGMDTNIIGRLRIQGVEEPTSPSLTYIGVLRLSEPSHGNATGIGLADFTTEALAADINKEATYLNCLTSGFVTRAAIPMTFPNDLQLVEGALQALKVNNPNSVRLIAIRNTLHIDHVWVTEPIYEEIRGIEGVHLTSEPYLIPFDQEGNWIW